jgi:hypothetical protein
MPRIAARHGDGYAFCRLRHAFFGRCLICWYCSQSFNSLGQNPCTVAAYLMSTCNGRCEHSSSPLCPYIFEPCRLISFSAFTIKELAPGYHYTGPGRYDDTDLCKCNTVTYSLLSACVACQGEEWISYGIPFVVVFKSLGLMYLTLGGRNICTTAQRFCLPRREFPVTAETFKRLT